MPAINGFLKSTHAPGDPSRGVPGAGDANTVANVLNDIQGVGCRIEKPMDRGGLGWHIVVDGSTDISYPDGSTGPTALSFSKAITKVSADSVLKGGAGSQYGTWAGSFVSPAEIETNPTILEATTNGILVKAGHAGVFIVHMSLLGTISRSNFGADWYVDAKIRIATAPTKAVWHMFYRQPVSSNTTTFPVWSHTEPTLTEDSIGVDHVDDMTMEENSTTSAIFVNAMTGDVLLDVAWQTSAPNGSSTIILREFTVELSELVTAAKEP